MTDAVDSPHDDSRVGSFRYLFASDEWLWSDEVARMHGYEPGSVVPTTELIVSHKHPDDRGAFEEKLTRANREHTHLSSRHRIIDIQGREHDVTVIGRTFGDDSDTPIGTEGYYVDLTPADDAVRDQVAAHIEDFRQSHATIEQAKGMLMVIYGVSAGHAFDVLRWRSQQENIKLKDLCALIVESAVRNADVPQETRSDFDLIVLGRR
ncbi:PAS and ANTAR domain-containing protein [Gordonia neofelifaecis]|uniref:PAS fold-3 domain-containing protein n=1 Tax=Gordonia neofelifaecis NRRL B-59395 TaxID=644548 RepID=F1YMK4_9ACTN|nr:PAS and ANTAR domain-containing protein [Gordonia neofelifaecis]EGD54129.1 PAS fold-3 domain-containing protein [Gordonia neofelifaecis NRRL B-59395]